MPRNDDEVWQDGREKQLTLVKAMVEGALEEEMTSSWGLTASGERNSGTVTGMLLSEGPGHSAWHRHCYSCTTRTL